MDLQNKTHTTGAAKAHRVEEAISSAFILIALFILPSLGGTAMLVGPTIGLGAYLIWFPDRFRTRSGSLSLAVWFLAVFAVASLIVLVNSFIRGRWN
jgi:hypothetical protein